MIPPLYRCAKRHQETKYLAQGQIASEQQACDLNTGSLEPEVTNQTKVPEILKVAEASESPGGLINDRSLDPNFRVSYLWSQGQEARILHSY